MRKCIVSGKKVMFGNRVSHSKRATRRRFEINLVDYRIDSGILAGRNLQISADAMRTLVKHGGIEGYLITTRNSSLSDEMRKLKKVLLSAETSAENVN